VVLIVQIKTLYHIGDKRKSEVSKYIVAGTVGRNEGHHCMCDGVGEAFEENSIMP
jgi:hypothetical protein